MTSSPSDPPRTTRWPGGAPCWATLATADEDRARDFYAAVLGWDYRDIGPRQHDWTLAEVAGGTVAGIGALPDAGAAAWTLWFAAEDVSEAAAAVVNAGGAVVAPAHDVLQGAARGVVARDAGGAQFALLQSDTFLGFTRVNAPGALLWLDAHTGGPARNRAFYEQVFGHAVTAMPEAGDDYALFAAAPDEPPYGGLAGPEPGSDPHWLLYFGVDDVDAAVTRVQEHDGAVVREPQDTPWGRIARVADPEGAPFALMSADWSDTPDRSA